MYKVPIWQIKGAPGWLDTACYDIEAKADRPRSMDDLHLMFQNLLADEFKLKFHRETREGPVYSLSVDRAGSKLKINESQQEFKNPISPGNDGVVIGRRVSMQYLSWWLAQVLERDERPMIDETGLDKNYDFTLSFLPELPPDYPRKNLSAALLALPSIVDALREQLGLKLEPKKGPVEYYTLDHVEKPAGN